MTVSHCVKQSHDKLDRGNLFAVRLNIISLGIIESNFCTNGESTSGNMILNDHECFYFLYNAKTPQNVEVRKTIAPIYRLIYAICA